VTVEVLNSPSTATQQLLGAILEELRGIRQRLDRLESSPQASTAMGLGGGSTRPAA